MRRVAHGVHVARPTGINYNIYGGEMLRGGFSSAYAQLGGVGVPAVTQGCNGVITECVRLCGSNDLRYVQTVIGQCRCPRDVGRRVLFRQLVCGLLIFIHVHVYVHVHVHVHVHIHAVGTNAGSGVVSFRRTRSQA